MQKKKKEEEKQQKRKEQEMRKEVKGKGRSKSKKGKECAPAQDNVDSLSCDEYEEPTTVRCSERVRQPPARFQENSSAESDSDEGTLCGLCRARDPISSKASIVFWVDCSNCATWFHTACAMGDNSSSHQYVCEICNHL